MIASLKSELNSFRVEKDRLQTLWLESQNELVSEQTKIKKLMAENDLLQTRLGIAEGVKIKSDRGLEELNEESFEHKKEAAKLYSELKKMQPVVLDLQEKNKQLEFQLHDVTLKLSESHVNHGTTKQMLRSEIRRLSQDRSTLRQEMSYQDKSILHVEKDSKLHKEMIEKLKSERYELQRQVFTLKRRADDAERKYFDEKLKSRQIEKQELLHRKVQFKSKNQMKSASVEVGKQVDVKQLNDAIIERKIQELPDFESWRLKLETLTNEKEFLMNENSSLKKRVADVSITK
jgi:chromosome segregation ATPase